MHEYAEEKRTKQDLIVRSGKFDAEVTNSKRRRSKYRIAEANYRQTRSSRGLSATTKLLVWFCVVAYWRAHDEVLWGAEFISG